MKHIVVFVLLTALTACAGTPAPDQSSSVAALEARIAQLEADNKSTRLKLADEMERADVQLYLTRQEIVTAKREAAALKAKCGTPCAP